MPRDLLDRRVRPDQTSMKKRAGSPGICSTNFERRGNRGSPGCAGASDGVTLSPQALNHRFRPSTRLRRGAHNNEHGIQDQVPLTAGRVWHHTTAVLRKRPQPCSLQGTWGGSGRA